MLQMVGVALKQRQIFGGVVVRLAVLMVHNFGGQQVAAQNLLHYEPMFPDIPDGIGKGMFRAKNLHIALSVFSSAAIPVAVMFPGAAVWLTRNSLPGQELPQPRGIRPHGFGDGS